jgi:hypothetical protein
MEEDPDGPSYQELAVRAERLAAMAPSKEIAHVWAQIAAAYRILAIEIDQPLPPEVH